MTVNVLVPAIVRLLAIPVVPTFRTALAPLRVMLPSLLRLRADEVIMLSVPLILIVAPAAFVAAPVMELPLPLKFKVPVPLFANEVRLTLPVKVDVVLELFVRLVPVRVRPLLTET